VQEWLVIDMLAPVHLRDRLQSTLGTAYTLERELSGGGGMARVFLAEELQLGRKVVVKVLSPELAADISADRFEREIRLAASLQQANIIPVLSAGNAGGVPYYTMPFAEGESLRSRVATRGALPISETIGILRDMARALSYAHAHGVVHRDIKPDNVLLSHGTAVVTDFGIAKAISASRTGTGSPTLTQAGVAIGTPAYMAPEQVAGDPAIDHRADIYAFGCVAYELLTGRPPFEGMTLQRLLGAHIAEPPQPVGLLRKETPPILAALVMRCLAKQPADRPATADELTEALDAFAAPQPVSQEMPAPPRARRWVSIAALSAVVVTLAIVASVWRPWHHASTPVGAIPEHASVAVMPFKNLTGNPAYQYMCDGMTEEVINQLARVVKVISKTSTEALSSAHLTTRQIAESLRVRYVLEGSFQHAGNNNKIKVSVHLIEAATDAQIWSKDYPHDLARDFADLFTVEEEIAGSAADSLASAVGGRPKTGGVSRTSSRAALEAYEAGRNLIKTRARDDVRKGHDKFQEAIEQDSMYAPAYAGLAASYYLWVFYDYPGVDFYRAYGRAWAKADRAIALDSNLAEAYAARGYVLSRSWAPANQISPDFKKALELRPNSADIHQWYANFLSREARHEEAIAEAKHAVELDPVAPGVRVAVSLGGLAAHRNNLIAPDAEFALTLQPSLVRARALAALGYLLEGHADRCAALSLGPYAIVRALCFYSMGRTGEAERIADSLRVAFKTAAVGDSTFNRVGTARGLAEYSAWTGNAVDALSWLERAYEISPVGEDLQVIESGIYDRVRNDARFKSGLEKLRTTIYARVQRAKVDAGRE
jgi:serine/threonine-protein kinase